MNAPNPDQNPPDPTNQTPPDNISGWFDAVLTTRDFREHTIGQFSGYKEAKETAYRIMQMESDSHPYALRVRITPAKRKLSQPPLKPKPEFL